MYLRKVWDLTKKLKNLQFLSWKPHCSHVRIVLPTLYVWPACIWKKNNSKAYKKAVMFTMLHVHVPVCERITLIKSGKIHYDTCNFMPHYWRGQSTGHRLQLTFHRSQVTIKMIVNLQWVHIYMLVRSHFVFIHILASSRRSVSWGAGQKTVREKIKKVRQTGSEGTPLGKPYKRSFQVYQDLVYPLIGQFWQVLLQAFP